MIMPITKVRKRVIVDVDTQRHFFLNRGIARVQNRRLVLANIRRVVAWARLKNIPMISTVQTYASETGYYNFYTAGTEDQKKISYTLRNRHASFDADDRTDLPSELLQRYDQVILYKRCFDPFKEPRADRMLSELQADEFILIGAMTEGAVKATALGLLARQKNVTVLVDATGSHDKVTGKIALRQMWVRGAKLIDTQTLVGSLYLQLAEAPNRNYC